MKTELLLDAKAHLGEGPVWDAKTQTLYWLDILGQRLHIYQDHHDRVIDLPDLVGCLAVKKSGGLIIALRLGFTDLDPDSGKWTPFAAPEGERSTNRFNDGKCDPKGRLLAGTMDLNERDSNGAFYSLEVDGHITRLLSGITISNGLTWSPDYKTLYYIDTPTRKVQAFDYDLETGSISNARDAITIHESLGWPDGMTCDMQGNLWIAMWGGSQITRWDPRTGKLLERIPVPAINVSSCVFGGKNMNELYITSARKGLDSESLSRVPLTGGLFRLQTNVEGMPSFEFGN